MTPLIASVRSVVDAASDEVRRKTWVCHCRSVAGPRRGELRDAGAGPGRTLDELLGQPAAEHPVCIEWSIDAEALVGLPRQVHVTRSGSADTGRYFPAWT